MIEVIPGRTSQEVVDRTRADPADRLPPRGRARVPASSRTASSTRSCNASTSWTGHRVAEALDLNVRWGIGYKLAVVGPMALLDMAGMDIYDAVGSYLNKDLCNRPTCRPRSVSSSTRGDSA